MLKYLSTYTSLFYLFDSGLLSRGWKETPEILKCGSSIRLRSRPLHYLANLGWKFNWGMFSRAANILYTP